jgi:hypothetical protein
LKPSATKTNLDQRKRSSHPRELGLISTRFEIEAAP